MTKNNLKVVKTDNKKEQELKEKNKSLEAAISQIDQNFGKGSVMRLGQQQALDIEAISTGSLSLDLALGIGGLPKGRIKRKKEVPRSRYKPNRPEFWKRLGNETWPTTSIRC